MLPEEKARLVIDRKLEEAGYVVQDKDDLNLKAAEGVVVRRYPTSSGEADYIVFICQKPVGVIEAKEAKKGDFLSTAELQTNRYANDKLAYIDNEVLRFRWECTEYKTFFTDIKDINYRSREVFSFFKPEELKRLLRQGDETLRNNLKKENYLNEDELRGCQVVAIKNLEKSFSKNKPRALIQMATGAGKTVTAINAVYRLLKFSKAKRILFLVNTKNLAEQAETAFKLFKPTDDSRLFTELYGVQRLNSSHINSDTQVCISTIQRMYSILKNEEFDEKLEETIDELEKDNKVRYVQYNKNYPPEFFDFIIIDECHRSIYNVWKQVLEYFDAFLIGLTATPDQRTISFFHNNAVSDYSRQKAIIDGVNVGEERFIIETEISNNGGLICEPFVDVREKSTRKEDIEELEDEIVYTNKEIDKTIVVPSQIRLILQAFKNAVKQIYKDRKEFPKTLIFAKDDSHAEDIVREARIVFDEYNDSCKRITYSENKAQEVLKEFRNGINLRIAVTVDMIATGTDVKPLECLLFMRDVRSKNYYEQMLGRGTRVLSLEELQKVSPSARYPKDKFIVFDAVGVTKSAKTETITMERRPGKNIKELIMEIVAGGKKDENTIVTLAWRLITLNQVLSKKQKQKFLKLTSGLSLSNIAENLTDCFNEEKIKEKIEKDYSDNPPEEYLEKTQNEMIEKATEPLFKPEIRNFIINARKNEEQIISNEIDTLIKCGWENDISDKANETIKSIRELIDENKDKMEALKIIYNQPYRYRDLTYDAIKELWVFLQEKIGFGKIEIIGECYKIKHPNYFKNPLNKFTDIITLIRFEWGLIDLNNIDKNKGIPSFSETVAKNFKDWIFEKNSKGPIFDEEKTNWLREIKQIISRDGAMTEEYFEYEPFAPLGGLGRYYELFGDESSSLLEEINKKLISQ